MNRAVRWLRARMGVRVVSALAAAGTVAVVLVVAGVALVLLVDFFMRSSVADAADQQATLLGQRIAGNFTTTAEAKKNATDATGGRSDLVQVVTDYNLDTDENNQLVRTDPKPDIQVIGSSDTLGQRPRMTDLLVPPEATAQVDSTMITLNDGTREEVLVVAKGFLANGRPITVLAAQPLQPVHQAVDTVEPMVAVGVPFLALVVGAFTYLFAWRALRPVEAIRSRVAGLTDRDLSRRVPEPETLDEVGRLARTMNQMLSRLESSQAAQRRFVADASHELRSPLATVSTGLELLGAGTEPGTPDAATVHTLRGEASRLTSLVENLLFLARADERGVVPRREEVDLDEIAEAERVRPSTDDRVAVTVSTEPVRVTGDRGQLVRIVRNLVDNARRHAGRSVLVTVRSADAVAVVDVEDDGPGVPEADRARVFERFVRLDEARSRGDGGSGLGLAIVAELVAAHGGGVGVDRSESLGGARFRVRVPLAAIQAGPVPADDRTGTEAAQDDERKVPVSTISTTPPAAPTPPGREPMGGRVGAPPVPARTGPEHVRPGPAGPGHTSPEHTSSEHTGPVPVVPAGPRAYAPAPVPRRAVDPPTGPLPIRPNTVGSPFDQNATRPLPIVPSSARAGTVVADAPERPADEPAPPGQRPRRWSRGS